jgi:hypothetical protein
MSAPTERRSDQRVKVSGAFLKLLSREPAHILDVSPGGALLETSTAALPGTEGQLEARLNGRPFSAAVKVTHIRRPQNSAAGAKAGVGVEFRAMNEDSREALSRFLRTADGSHG